MGSERIFSHDLTLYHKSKSSLYLIDKIISNFFHLFYGFNTGNPLSLMSVFSFF